MVFLFPYVLGHIKHVKNYITKGVKNMRFNRAKKEAIIFNKVNGKEYLITKEDWQGVIAEALIPDANETQTDPDDTVRITEANCICFRVIKDAPTTDPVGFSIYVDGILCKDGLPATEQGELRFSNILCTLPGVIYLTSERMDGNVDLYAYRPYIDRFIRLISDIPSPQPVKINDEEYAFVYSKTHTETTEDGCEKCILDKAGVVFVNRRCHITSGKFSCTLGKPFAVDDGTLFFIKKDHVNEEGILEEIPPCTLSVSDNAMIGYNVSSEIYGIAADQAKHCVYGGILLISKDELLYTQFGKKNGVDHDIRIKNKKILALIRKGQYGTVVDLTKEDGVILLTLSSDDYRTMTISIRDTSDRGQVVKIVEA